MEKYSAILGLISICLTGVLCQDMTVTVTQSMIKVKPGEPVTLSCLGSSNQLDFYIKNRVNWEFISSQGVKHLISEGFYPATDNADYSERLFAEGHFTHKYDAGSNAYIFTLNVTAARDADNGIYRCSLVNGKGDEMDHKDVTVTVLRPVDKVTVEIHDPKSHTVLAKKTVPVSAQDQAVELRPGNYMVKCVATGSNPEPEVEFMYNDKKETVTWKTDKDTSGDRVKFSKSWMSMNFALQPHEDDQFLTCTANIADGGYTPKTASIKMAVRVDKPDVVCSNTTAMLNDHYTRITCNLTGRGLMCDNVKWIIGNNDDVIDVGQQYGGENLPYDIMESSCDNYGDRIETSLEIYEVKPSHFETIFYVSYGIGKDAHRSPVMLDMKPGGTGSLMTPLSLCVYLVLAYITRQAFQRF